MNLYNHNKHRSSLCTRTFLSCATKLISNQCASSPTAMLPPEQKLEAKIYFRSRMPR